MDTQDEKYARLLAALTPGAGTKAAFLGEFKFKSPNGRMEYAVPWTTIKEIMAAIRKLGGAE